MFTLKLMRGLNNELIDVVEAKKIRIRRRSHIDMPPDVAIVVNEGGPDEFWYYVTNTPEDGHYTRGIVENANGKTTEVIHP